MALLLAVQGTAGATGPDSTAELIGVVVTAAGQPIARANVFLEATLDGATTDESGVFRLRSQMRGDATLLIRAIGFAPHHERLQLPHHDTVRVTMGATVVPLDAVRIEAGRHTAGSEQGASLTALEVASIPGARGDIARAFQTLPGVHTVDEGTGLFVRGGDSPETRVFLNGAELVDPQRIETPLGSASSTVDPFLLEGIAFATGAFSARYGNALSAIAELRTSGRPPARRSTLHGSLASVSGRTSIPIGAAAGLHATANVSDSRYSIALNGSPRRYDRAPHGRTFSASTVWQYRRGAELKLFGLDRRNGMRVWADGAGFTDVSELDERNSALLLTWKDRFGAVDVSGGTSVQRLRRVERFGTLDILTERRSPQAFVGFDWPIKGGFHVRTGADLDMGQSDLSGSVPLLAFANAPGSPVRVIERRVRGHRHGVYGETEFLGLQRLRVRAGLRTDESGLTSRRTWDPRASVTYLPGSLVALMLAAGVFHQVPDALVVAFGGESQLPAMRARQITAGLTAGTEERMVRVEAYERQFEDLVQLDRERRVLAQGVGSARGADIFVRGSLPSDLEARVVYSLLRARRTDPNSGLLAAASFDITHSALLLIEKGWYDRLTVGATYRFATGRPFTPILGAQEVITESRTHWIPQHGAPYSARLPTFQRLDLSASILHSLPLGGLVSTYISAYNLLGRRNVAAYRYSADYTMRFPVRSPIGRGLFFGSAWSF